MSNSPRKRLSTPSSDQPRVGAVRLACQTAGDAMAKTFNTHQTQVLVNNPG